METVVFQADKSRAVRLVADAWPRAFIAAAGSWTEDIPRPGNAAITPHGKSIRTRKRETIGRV